MRLNLIKYDVDYEEKDKQPILARFYHASLVIVLLIINISVAAP